MNSPQKGPPEPQASGALRRRPGRSPMRGVEVSSFVSHGLKATDLWDGEHRTGTWHEMRDTLALLSTHSGNCRQDSDLMRFLCVGCGIPCLHKLYTYPRDPVGSLGLPCSAFGLAGHVIFSARPLLIQRQRLARESFPEAEKETKSEKRSEKKSETCLQIRAVGCLLHLTGQL